MTSSMCASIDIERWTCIATRLSASAWPLLARKGMSSVRKSLMHSLPHGTWSYLDGCIPTYRQQGTSLRMTTTYSVSGASVRQEIEIENLGDSPLQMTASFDGKISINRSAYTQLTPQGDCSIPPVLNRVIPDNTSIAIENPYLPACISVTFNLDGIAQSLSAPASQTASPVEVSSSSTFTLSPRTIRRATMMYRVTSTLHELGEPSEVQSTLGLVSLLDVERLQNVLAVKGLEKQFAFIIIRNLDYLLSCCTVPVKSPSGVDLGICIITDHQCLPLGWNRDN
jgi:hypothetical protein